jgi:hypothetical protein
MAAQSTPALMKAVMALLPPQLRLRPVWRDTEAGWDIPLRYTVEGTETDRASAKVLLSNTMTPLPVKEIAKELTTLNALTKRRREDQGDTQLMIAAYTERLMPYPGESVIHVLRKWPETKDGKWWPAWADLFELLEARCAERMLMLEALG